MSKEFIYPMIPIVGIWISIFIRFYIDGRCRKILQAQGKNPNPKELELYKGVILPGRHFERIKEDIQARRDIDPKLGQWYYRTHIFSVAMLIVFFITVFLI